MPVNTNEVNVSKLHLMEGGSKNYSGVLGSSQALIRGKVGPMVTASVRSATTFAFFRLL
jgi:hypothetical protein